MTPSILEDVLSALAAIASEKGGLVASGLPTLSEQLAVLERHFPAIDLFRASRIAQDLHEIHARLGASPASPAAARLRERIEMSWSALEARSDACFSRDRARLRAGELRGEALVAWLAAYPPEEREMAIEHLFGIAQRPLGKRALHPDLIDYIPSGIGSVIRAVSRVPIGPDDVFVDLGSGLGKVTLAVHLLSGARVRGIELQKELVDVAVDRAHDLGLPDLSYEQGDARFADLSGASVVFLYLPFTGDTLAAVMQRIEAVARQRSLVVCTLGLDLRAYGWLEEREMGELWLTIYDSRMPGVPPRRSRAPNLLGAAVEAVASEWSMSPDVGGTEPHL